MIYREQPPGIHLSQFVECFWSVEPSAAVNAGVPPDGCVDIIFSPEFGLRAVGVMTVEQIFPLHAQTQIVGVRFRPGRARSILGLSPREFTDNFISLEDLWPRRGKELRIRMQEAKSAAHRFQTLRHALGMPEEAANPVQRAIAALSSAHGDLDLDGLASQANLSSRQFRRRCHQETGLTPKHLCRILRFRRAQQLAAGASKVNWSRIAAETGYFDQAHLIRDFREFTGRTPASVFSNTRTLALT